MIFERFVSFVNNFERGEEREENIHIFGEAREKAKLETGGYFWLGFAVYRLMTQFCNF